MRIVMFVLNDARTDSRVLREAASLRAAGHEVTIMARSTDPAATENEHDVVDGVEVIRVPGPYAFQVYWARIRYPWQLRHWWKLRAGDALRRAPLGLLEIVPLIGAALVLAPWVLIRLPFVLIARRRRSAVGVSTLDWVIRWRFNVLGWAKSAANAAPPADAWHGHDLTGLEAAGRAWQAHGGILVYDSHEIYVESGSIATRPRWLKWFLSRSERRWTAHAAALVTVNHSLADELGRRLQPRRTVVVHNAPERWDPPIPRPDLIRAATGIPAGDPIALYHGGFSAHRGLEELAAAIREPGLERVHAVYMGYGSQKAMVEGLAADPRSGGRAHVLAAVPPSELGPWVASADVGVMAIQPSTLNHRLSTPNKLFESLAAGLPVVTSDFTEMREIVLDDPLGPLGEVCRPDDPADLARAIRAILDLPPEEREALRARCLAAAHARWNWEAEVAGLLQLYQDVGPPTSTRAPEDGGG